MIGERIVRQTMILTLDVREFRLNEDVFAAHCRTDGGLVVMTALVCGVNAAEARAQR